MSEPTLNGISDYNKKLSPQKRNTIIIAMGAGLALMISLSIIATTLTR